MEHLEENCIRPERSRPGLFAASGFYLLAAAGLWAMGFLSPLVAGLMPNASYERLNLVINLLYYGGLLFLPIALWASRKTGMAEGLRLNPIPPMTLFATVILALLCMWIAYEGSVLWMILWQKLGLNVFTDDYIRPANTGELMRSVIAAGAIAGVCEELLFRGVLLSAWEKAGAKKAVLITAVMFALLHGSLEGLPGEIFGGCVLALIVLRTDSLYTGMIFHTVYNSALVMLSYVSSGAQDEAALAAEQLMREDIVAALGGWSSVAAMALEVAVLLLLVAVLLRGFQRRAKWFGIQACPAGSVSLSKGTIALLTLSGLSVAAMYVMNIANMLGG